jgi:hypothetical protein
VRPSTTSALWLRMIRPVYRLLFTHLSSEQQLWRQNLWNLGHLSILSYRSAAALLNGWHCITHPSSTSHPAAADTAATHSTKAHHLCGRDVQLLVHLRVQVLVQQRLELCVPPPPPTAHAPRRQSVSHSSSDGGGGASICDIIWMLPGQRGGSGQWAQGGGGSAFTHLSSAARAGLSQKSCSCDLSARRCTSAWLPAAPSTRGQPSRG